LDTSPDGQNYVERYNVKAFPHIGILDPRTGRLVHRKEGWSQVNPLTCEQFAEMAAYFCSRHSLDKPPQPKKVRDEEEEELQAAIRASMQTNDDDDDDDSSDFDVDDDDSQQMIHIDDDDDSMDVKVETPKIPSFQEVLATMEVGDEPTTNGDDCCRVMIRMPDGKRLVRRFLTQDTVKIIYAFVAQSKLEDRPFDLKVGFPPKNLFDRVDNTIRECGLGGETITVCWQLVD